MTRMVRTGLFALALTAALSTVVHPSDRFAQITIDATAGGIGFASAFIDPPGQPQANQASCRLETAEVRFTYDGTTVTTTVGTLLEINETLTLTGHDRLAQFKAIRTGATSGQLDCTVTP